MGSTANIPRIDRVVINGKKYTVKSAMVTATVSGNTQIIAAVSGKSLVIIAHEMTTDTELTVKVQDSSGSPPEILAGPWYPAANGGIVNSAYKDNDTGGGNGLSVDVNLSANGNVHVKLWYVET